MVFEAGEHRQGFLTYHLKRLDRNWWRYGHEHQGPSFDFTPEPRSLSEFAEKCHEQQTSLDSGFVRVTVCHRFTPTGILSLRGAVLQTVSREGSHERVIDSFAESRCWLMALRC